MRRLDSSCYSPHPAECPFITPSPSPFSSLFDPVRVVRVVFSQSNFSLTLHPSGLAVRGVFPVVPQPGRRTLTFPLSFGCSRALIEPWFPVWRGCFRPNRCRFCGRSCLELPVAVLIFYFFGLSPVFDLCSELHLIRPSQRVRANWPVYSELVLFPISCNSPPLCPRSSVPFFVPLYSRTTFVYTDRASSRRVPFPPLVPSPQASDLRW